MLRDLAFGGNGVRGVVGLQSSAQLGQIAMSAQAPESPCCLMQHSTDPAHLVEHAEVIAGLLGDTISAQAGKEKDSSES